MQYGSQTKMSAINQILKKHWNDYKSNLFPKDRRMRILNDKKVDGMSTENIRFLINEVVNKFAKNGVYMEVGVYRGCSLLSAALFNPSTRCIGIDNFSKFDFFGVDFGGNEKNEDSFKSNLLKFGNPKNIEFYREDYEESIKNLFSKEPGLKVVVYYYDGDHSYQNQLDGLKLIIPYLAEKCILLVDDINDEAVEKAVNDFIKENPAFKVVFKIKTEAKERIAKLGRGTEDWWNGFAVISRGI